MIISGLRDYLPEMNPQKIVQGRKLYILDELLANTSYQINFSGT